MNSMAKKMLEARQEGEQAEAENDFINSAKALADATFLNPEMFKKGVQIDGVKVVLISNDTTPVKADDGVSHNSRYLTIDFVDITTKSVKFSILDLAGTLLFRNGGEGRYNYFTENGLKINYDFRGVANKAVELAPNKSIDLKSTILR